ncbi:MAG: flagellar motor switch protein FliG [Gammaproteobacteria bacterium]
MINVQDLNGSDRAAIFLMSLEEREATEVLKHMPVAQVQKIGQAMAGLEKVSREEADEVLSYFTHIVESEAPLSGRSPQFLKRLLSGSLGEDQANTLLESLAGDAPTGLDSLQLMESKQVAELIRQEHPQVMAIVLAGLETKKSAEIISQLPTRVSADIIGRIAKLEEVPQHAIEELDEVLRERSSTSTGYKVQAIGGVRAAAEILNASNKDSGKKILEDLDERDADLSEEIQENMIVFENLRTLDDRGMQALLREVTSESLVMALKGAEEALKSKVFGNMSKRAAELLQDDLEAKGPVRVSEVEEAQKEIVSIARRMSDEGTLQLGTGSDDFI